MNEDITWIIESEKVMLAGENSWGWLAAIFFEVMLSAASGSGGRGGGVPSSISSKNKKNRKEGHGEEVEELWEGGEGGGGFTDQNCNHCDRLKDDKR